MSFQLVRPIFPFVSAQNIKIFRADTRGNMEICMRLNRLVRKSRYSKLGINLTSNMLFFLMRESKFVYPSDLFVDFFFHKIV